MEVPISWWITAQGGEAKLLSYTDLGAENEGADVSEEVKHP